MEPVSHRACVGLPAYRISVHVHFADPELTISNKDLNLLQVTRVTKVFCRNTYAHPSKLPSVVYEYHEQNLTPFQCFYLYF